MKNRKKPISHKKKRLLKIILVAEVLFLVFVVSLPVYEALSPIVIYLIKYRDIPDGSIVVLDVHGMLPDNITGSGNIVIIRNTGIDDVRAVFLLASYKPITLVVITHGFRVYSDNTYAISTDTRPGLLAFWLHPVASLTKNLVVGVTRGGKEYIGIKPSALPVPSKGSKIILITCPVTNLEKYLKRLTERGAVVCYTEIYPGEEYAYNIVENITNNEPLQFIKCIGERTR